MPSKRRGGFPALLTGLRLATKMPLTRTLVRKLAEEVESNGRKTTVALEALRLIAEHDTNSCLIARFYSKILSLVFKIAIACFHGEEEEVVEALRDPAVRRGLALVLEGLALYGVTVPQELPAPFLVVWN
ncbi:MAG: radical SAM/SPASM domain-containing protein, partial [Candidatus Altiarchaeales archaeon]